MLTQILFLHDQDGNLQAVQIPAQLWEKIKVQVLPNLHPSNPENDLEAFAEFQQAWSFPYAYIPEVECPSCHNHTPDWRNDDKFILKNANIGGMLVFHCRKCGSTLRQKYFKTHMDYDFTPPGR